MDSLELPTGETVTPEDAFCFGNYPYRFVPADEHDGDAATPAGPGPGPDEVSFYLVPLYWGGGDMDVPFRDREALVEQWDASRGVLTDEEWREWLADARGDDRFDGEELDAVARELGVADDGDAADGAARAGGGGPLSWLRSLLG